MTCRDESRSCELVKQKLHGDRDICIDKIGGSVLLLFDRPLRPHRQANRPVVL